MLLMRIRRCYGTALVNKSYIKSLLKSPKICLIDVRGADEVAAEGCIPNSKNIPIDELEYSLQALTPGNFQRRFGFEKPEVDQEIVFYCRSGKRSALASNIAVKLGYNDIKNYSGSWIDWTRE